MTAGIEARQDGAILRITLSRPEQENMVSDEMAIELARLLDGAGEKSSFVLLSAAGSAFCVGWGNYGSLPQPGSVQAFERLKKYDLVFNCYSAFRRCRVPIVGIVHGPARGFGCAIAALCDVTLASDSASFQIPELSHRILPTMVMSALADRVPLKAINYLVISGLEIGAQRALQLGIVSDVVANTELGAAATSLCERLLHVPRPALRGLKDYTRSALRMDPQGSTDYGRYLHATINTSSEMRHPG